MHHKINDVSIQIQTQTSSNSSISNQAMESQGFIFHHTIKELNLD